MLPSHGPGPLSGGALRGPLEIVVGPLLTAPAGPAPGRIAGRAPSAPPDEPRTVYTRSGRDTDLTPRHSFGLLEGLGVTRVDVFPCDWTKCPNDRLFYPIVSWTTPWVTPGQFLLEYY